MRKKGKKVRVFIVICLVSMLFSCSKEPGPEEALRGFVNSIVEKNFSLTWDYLSYKSQKDFETKVFESSKQKFAGLPDEKKSLKHPGLNVSIKDVIDMSARDYFILNLEKTDLRESILKSLDPSALKVEKTYVKGDTARLKLKGRASEITMQKENGKWRICLF